MNKNKDKNLLSIVVRALQKARVDDSVDGYTRLYITKKNGLFDIPRSELDFIIRSLEKDKVIEINHFPNYTEVEINPEPVYHKKDFEEALRVQGILEIFPRPVFPMNYFSLTIEPKFDKRFISAPNPSLLLALIPPAKKNQNHRRIAKLLIDIGKVPNSVIATRTTFKYDYVKDRPKKSDYLANKDRYNTKISNALKTLRKLWEPTGYKIRFNEHFTELIFPEQNPPRQLLNS